MSKHTPEPWAHGGKYNDLLGGNGKEISFWGLGASFGQRSEEREANTQRVLQCVNACAGLDMSNVPAGAVRELVEATMWRDETENTRLSVYNIPGHRELSQICEAARDAYKAALAPFKE